MSRWKRSNRGRAGRRHAARVRIHDAAAGVVLVVSSSLRPRFSAGVPEPAARFVSKEIVYPSDTAQTRNCSRLRLHVPWRTCGVLQKTTTLPAVPVEQNGSGVAAMRKEVYDSYGNLTWLMDERGFITRLKYDVVTGAVTQRIDDVDTAQVSDEPAAGKRPRAAGYTGHRLRARRPGPHHANARPGHTVDIGGTATSVGGDLDRLQRRNHQVRSGQCFATGTVPNCTLHPDQPGLDHQVRPGRATCWSRSRPCAARRPASSCPATRSPQSGIRRLDHEPVQANAACWIPRASTT